VLCTLFLRGPQTLGEIKDRSDRMYNFADLAEAEMVLDKLGDWPGGALVKKLPRQPGQKEARVAHLLCGEPVFEVMTETSGAHPPVGKVAQVEAELQELRAEFSELKSRLDALEAQWK
jgi:uncharacterized protein YceH (UPF0502 family)